LQVIGVHQESKLVQTVFTNSLSDRKSDKVLRNSKNKFNDLKSMKKCSNLTSEIMDINEDVEKCQNESYSKFEDLATALLMVEKLGDSIIKDMKEDEARDISLQNCTEIINAHASRFD